LPNSSIKYGESYLIKKRDFIHQQIKYSFNWNISHHKEKLDLSNSNREEFRRLGTYFKKIYQESIVPNELFNARNVQRISQFKIKGVKSTFLTSFSKQLIRNNIIKNYNSDSKLPQFAQNVYDIYEKNQINKKPGHDPILKHILIKDKDSVAIETPIWRKVNNQYITGHIDLIQIDTSNEDFVKVIDYKPDNQYITGHIDLIQIDTSNEDFVKVIDYKPEGKFMISLPQVATYGLMLKKELKLSNLKCISFNKKEAWEYDPSILLTEIREYLVSKGIKIRIWEDFV